MHNLKKEGDAYAPAVRQFFLEGKNGFNGEKKVTCCGCCASVFLMKNAARLDRYNSACYNKNRCKWFLDLEKE